MLTNDTLYNQYINNVPQIISVKQISLKDGFRGGMDMPEGTVRYAVVASWVCTLLLLAVCFLAAHELAVDLCILTNIQDACMHSLHCHWFSVLLRALFYFSQFLLIPCSK